MLFKIDKTEQERVTGSLNITSNEQVILSFSEDGKSWTTFKMSGKILHKILVDAQEYRENINDPELAFRRLNGRDFEAYEPNKKE